MTAGGKIDAIEMIQGFPAVGSGDDLVALDFQCSLDRGAKVCVVIDHEDGGHFSQRIMTRGGDDLG